MCDCSINSVGDGVVSLQDPGFNSALSVYAKSIQLTLALSGRT